MKEAILCQNLVPNNLDNVKKLDDFLRDILKEKRKTNKQNIENVLEKLQRKTVDLMGPLLKLWNILEGAKGAEEDAVQISINTYSITLDRLYCTDSSRLNVLGSTPSEFSVSSKTNVRRKCVTSPKI